MKQTLLASLLAAAGLLAVAPAGAQVSDDVVRIGVMNDMSGPYVEIAGPGSVLAARMAVADYLEATGSNLKVDVISADHQNKPDVGASIARKWFDVDGVDM
ncbi:ABC transporter substrate-binding protein, partial [Castellaniella sp.]|uniref:ABC transporter substrate-binding protein n=1 Tax=Castellaniella sp. TaxID=1955812 RepID=UPI0035640EF3